MEGLASMGKMMRGMRLVCLLFILLLEGFAPSLALAAAGTPVAVDDKVKAQYSGYGLNRTTNTFNNLATITNVSQVTINAPMRLVIANIKSNGSVTLANPSGYTSTGQPYVDIPLASGSFGPGQAAVNVVLSYNNPQRVSFTVTPSIQGVLTPANRPPTADAGADQTAYVGATATLDGSGSSDPDGDALAYAWTLAQRPAGSLAVLAAPASLHPTLGLDKPGSYVARLLVNDGQADSTPAQVTISTLNSKPVADAGRAQSGKVGEVLLLDGSASRDVDGDPLTFLWTLPARPSGSAATLANPTSQSPALTLDKPGSYTAQLVVNDGRLDSAPATVVLSTANSKPEARAGPAQTVVLTSPPPVVALDGTGSSDADFDPLSYRWSLSTKPSGSQSAPEDPASPLLRFTPDRAGDYVAQLIVNDGHLDSDPSTAQVTVTAPPNQTPHISSSPVAAATAGQLYGYDVNASDPDGDALAWRLTVYPAGMSIDAAGGQIRWTPATGDVGSHSVTVQVQDGRGGLDSQSFDLLVSPPDLRVTVPGLSGLARAAAGDTIRQARLNVGTESYQHSASVADGAVIQQSPAAGAKVDPGTAVGLTISLGPDTGLPPNPATLAPAQDTTVASTAAASAPFLYGGPNPVQTGVAAGTIDAKRTAILRGKALDAQGNPLPGVAVSVNGHAEYGQTQTRADGQFDLAVNGGGLLTLNYRKPGYLPAQRQVNAGWQGWAVAGDAVLAVPDAQVTAVALGIGSPAQAVQGSQASDSDGSRRATVLLPAGTTATMTLADGSQQALSSLHVRATEYTVGGDGPKAMPGPLPPTSGYTYAVELSADEALAVGAKSVDFNQALPVYVDNFLGFPVGTVVPAAWYDTGKAAWIPSDNGKVIQILSISAGSAQIDADGNGQADSAAQLAALGITAAEQTHLATLYAAGKALWRVPVRHFTPWDFNWPVGPPQDAAPPNPSKPPQSDPKPQKPTCANGSVIECESQILGESIPVAGTPYSLNYRSDRVPGRGATYTLDIPVSGAAVPASLIRIELQVSVAGRSFAYTLPAAANQTHRFTWDGKDAYGRGLQGAQTANIRTGFVYAGVYYQAAGFARAFASVSGIPISGSRARQEVTLWQDSSATLGGWDARAEGLGGWTLDAHHSYDPTTRVLYQGDGSRRTAEALGGVAETAAGTGTAGFGGDGGNAQAALLNSPVSIASAPDGSLYLSDNGNNRVRRIAPDGTLGTVAGTGAGSFGGDGGPAASALLNKPGGIAAGPDGSLYIADTFNHRIRKVSPAGAIGTVAGNGTPTFAGDGGAATSASLFYPAAVAVAQDGSLYIADAYNHRIRRVGTGGTIGTVAGNGSTAFGGDGGAATSASLYQPSGVAFGADGSLYIADYGHHRIRKVSPAGLISTVAGTGTPGYSGDGGAATSAQLNAPVGLAVAANGSVLIADSGNNRIRRVGTDGLISTVAGNGQTGPGGDGGAASSARVSAPWGVVEGADGNVYAAEYGGQRIRRIRPAMPGFSAGRFSIPSGDGGVVYQFDASGRHQRTVSTLTGATLLSFGYDSQGRLLTLTDGDGDTTTLERDAQGQPAAIAGPYGQRTTLSLDANGYLATATNPAGETRRMAYTGSGLLTRFEDPKGQASILSYDAQGRLTQDENADGGRQTLARTDTANGYTATRATRLGRTATHQVENLADGSERHTRTGPDGTATQTLTKLDGTRSVTAPDGTVTSQTPGPDPRFGLQAPLAQSLTVASGGLTASYAQARSAVLNTANDPLSLKTLTDTLTVNGRTSTTVYDTASKTATRTSAASRTRAVTFDAQGRPVKSTVPGLLDITYGYDSHGRLGSATQGSRTTTYAYDSQGRLASATDPLGRISQTQYDAANRPTVQTFPDGRQARAQYDANGNLQSLTPPGRPAHGFAHTATDLTARYTPPDVGAGTNKTDYAYDLDQALTQTSRPDGQSIQLAYDSAGRLQTLTTPEGGSTYGYSATTGKLASLAAPGGTGLAYTYSGALLTQTQWTGPVAGRVGHGYDNDFRISSLSVNGANPVAYQYDADSLLTTAGAMSLNRSAQNGLLTGTTLGSLADTRTYDGYGAVTAYTAQYNTAPFYTYGLTYDSLGRITQKAETVQGAAATYAYAYDPAGRLGEVRKDGVLTASYGYDDNGNRVTLNGAAVATYDDQDRLTSYNGTSYAYTANGELQGKTAGGQATAYRYDVLGNLRQATLPGGTAIDYVIDGRNRRIGKKLNGNLIQGFLYQDGLRPVAELDGSNQVVSRFVYADKGNVPSYMVKGGITYRIFSDHLGSPRLIVKTTDGTVMQRLDYDEWGRVLSDTNPGFQPFGFAGGLYDRDTGLVRFGARDYDPETGRWTAKDPILFDGEDTNLYAYVLNDPVNAVDPLGLQSYYPPLIRIHPESTIMSGSNRFSYDYWKNKSTRELVDSLCPGSESPLTVSPDGRIFNGNVRTLILEQRGYDINSLPREIYNGGGIPEPR